MFVASAQPSCAATWSTDVERDYVDGWLDATMKRHPMDGMSPRYYEGWREGLRYRVHCAMIALEALRA